MYTSAVIAINRGGDLDINAPGLRPSVVPALLIYSLTIISVEIIIVLCVAK
jgi:hypothetical protein